MISSSCIPPPGEAPKLASAGQLARWFRVSPRTVMNWSRTGILPKPVPLSERKNLFRVEEVRQAILSLEGDRWVTREELCNGKTTH